MTDLPLQGNGVVALPDSFQAAQGFHVVLPLQFIFQYRGAAEKSGACLAEDIDQC